MQKKKLLLSIFADKALRLEYFSCFKQIEVQLKLSTGSWRVFPIKWRNLLRSLNLKLSNHLSCGEGSLWQTTLIGYYLCGDLSGSFQMETFNGSASLFSKIPKSKFPDYPAKLIYRNPFGLSLFKSLSENISNAFKTFEKLYSFKFWFESTS